MSDRPVASMGQYGTTWPIPLGGLGVMGSWSGGMPSAKHFAKLKHFVVRFPSLKAKKNNLMYRLDLNNDNASFT